MGNFFNRLFSKKAQVAPKDQDNQNEDNAETNKYNNYEDDAHDAAYLALSMMQKDETTNYELSISCEGLPKMDTLSLTDAMVVVYIMVDNAYKEVGKTEVINNNLDPKFSKAFIIPYSPDRPNQTVSFHDA
jgi:hypothetical protein